MISSSEHLVGDLFDGKTGEAKPEFEDACCK
jgi:hypothetical protein